MNQSALAGTRDFLCERQKCGCRCNNFQLFQNLVDHGIRTTRAELGEVLVTLFDEGALEPADHDGLTKCEKREWMRSSVTDDASTTTTTQSPIPPSGYENRPLRKYVIGEIDCCGVAHEEPPADVPNLKGKAAIFYRLLCESHPHPVDRVEIGEPMNGDREKPPSDGAMRRWRSACNEHLNVIGWEVLSCDYSRSTWLEKIER